MRQDIYEFLIKKQNNICPLCGKSLEMDFYFYLLWRIQQKKKLKRTKINIDVDHKVPKSLIKDAKWKNSEDNLQLTHKICNSEKGNRCLSYVC